MSGKLFAILRLPFKSERTLVRAALPASDQYVFRIRKKEANRERLKLYTLEPPCGGGSNEHPQSIIWAEIWKISFFFIWKFSGFGGDFFFVYIWIGVFS